MFRKMIAAFMIVSATAAWTSAKPGTWGKEPAADEKQSTAPAAAMNRWLNEFTSAYQQRDGEKMNELIKRFESDRQESPAAPRLDKWIGKVKQAYDQQDIRKMGRLVDNAHQLRERMKERMIQNRNRRMGQRADALGPQRQQMRGFGGQFEDRMAQRPRGFNRQPIGAQNDFGPGGRQGLHRRAGMHDDRFFERQNWQQRPFDTERPAQPQWGPRRRFAPEQRPGYDSMPQRQQQRFGRADLGPGPEGRKQRFERPFRRDFDQPYDDDQQGPRRQMRQ